MSDHSKEAATKVYMRGVTHSLTELTADFQSAIDAATKEKDAEIERLTTLSIAVGNHSFNEVPEDVYKAWKAPAKYREDEICKLREQVASGEHEANCLRREIAALKANVAELEAK